MSAVEPQVASPPLRTRLLCWLVGLLGAWVIRGYHWFVYVRDDPASRRRRLGKPTGRPEIYVCWHAQQLTFVHHWRGCGARILVSRHTDGEMIARVAERMGLAPVRGSSTRGAATALRSLMAALEENAEVAVTPDGPRGPRQRSKTGLIQLARKTGAPIIPAAIGLSRYWELPSWDRFRIPKPFARGVCMLGTPLHVPRDADEDALRRFRKRVDAALNALAAKADRLARRP